MENPEETLHHLEEFCKLKPKSIPRELEDYLCLVAKTGDPVYQWSVIKYLFREKLINVITDFYESCPSMDIPPCPNVDLFNYDTMKTFILEKLDTFVAAPFTVQRICELLTTPRKEYNRIDKYMRALEKNILVVSTTEPGQQRTPENVEGFVNGIESDHIQDGSNDINIEEMDDSPMWPRKEEDSFQSTSKEQDETIMDSLYNNGASSEELIEPVLDTELESEPSSSSSTEAPALETVITCCPAEEHENDTVSQETSQQSPTIDANAENSLPAVVQRRRNSIEPELSPLADDKPLEREYKDKENEETTLESQEEPIKSVDEVKEQPDSSQNKNSREETAEKVGDEVINSKCEPEIVEQEQTSEEPHEIDVADVEKAGIPKQEEAEDSNSMPEVTGMITVDSDESSSNSTSTTNNLESNLSDSSNSNDSAVLQSEDTAMDVDVPIVNESLDEGNVDVSESLVDVHTWQLADRDKAEVEAETVTVLPDQQQSEEKSIEEEAAASDAAAQAEEEEEIKSTVEEAN